VEWDNSGLLNKQGFLTKRGGNIKVSEIATILHFKNTSQYNQRCSFCGTNTKPHLFTRSYRNNKILLF